MAMKHVYKIELEQEDMPPQKAAEAALSRLHEDGRKAELVKNGNVPVISIEGAHYHLTVVTGASSGIGVQCAVLKEQ